MVEMELLQEIALIRRGSRLTIEWGLHSLLGVTLLNGMIEPLPVVIK